MSLTLSNGEQEVGPSAVVHGQDPWVDMVLDADEVSTGAPYVKRCTSPSEKETF